MDALATTSQLRQGFAPATTFPSNLTSEMLVASGRPGPELVSSSGSYRTADMALDTVIFLLTVTTSMLAILVLARRRRQNSLLDHLFCLESVGSLAMALAFYGPLLARHVGWWTDVPKDSRLCRAVFATILSVTAALLLNALFLTILRLLSIARPFMYDRRLAFSLKVLVPAAGIFMLLPAVTITVLATRPQLIKLRMYNHLCLADLHERGQAPFVFAFTSVCTAGLALILLLDLVLACQFHRLAAPPVTTYWDSAMAEQQGAVRDGGVHSDSTGERARAHAPRISYKRKSSSVAVGLLKGDQGALGLRPLWRCFSDTDLPKSLRTHGNEPPAEEGTADPVNVSRQNSGFQGKSLHRRSSTTDVLPCRKYRPRCLYYKVRHSSLHKLKLVQHRLKASPMTKLVMALSLSHVIGTLPSVVIMWIEVDPTSGDVSPAAVIWSVRLWMVTLVINSFLYVLARKSYKADIDRILKPIEELFLNLCCCFARNKRRPSSDW